MNATCHYCQAPFEARSPRAKFCSSSCRGRSARNKDSAKVVALPEAPKDSVGPMTAATLAELELAGRAGTAKGRLAIEAAQRIDRAGPLETGASFAATARELRTSLDEALVGAPAPADALDELERKRLERARRAGVS